MPFLPCFILSTDTDTVVTDALFQRILVMLLGDHVPHWSGNGISFFFSKRLNAKKESMPKQSSTNLLGQMSGYKNTIIGLHPITVLGHPQWATPESRNWPTTKCFASYLSLLLPTSPTAPSLPGEHMTHSLMQSPSAARRCDVGRRRRPAPSPLAAPRSRRHHPFPRRVLRLASRRGSCHPQAFSLPFFRRRYIFSSPALFLARCRYPKLGAGGRCNQKRSSRSRWC